MEKIKSDKLLSPQIAYFMFAGLGFLFAFSCLTVRELNAQRNIVWTLPVFLKIAGSSLALGGMAGAALCFLIYRHAKARKAPAKKAEASKQASPRLIFAVSLCLIALCWLPGFLAYYPAICAYDVPIQTGQIVSGNYNDHHPIAHTLLIEWAMTFGKNVLGSVNTGIGLLAFLQLLSLDSAFAWGIVMLGKCGVKRGWQIVLLAYAMFFPFHSYMSVSITKDTVFTIFVIVMLVTMCVILHMEDAESGSLHKSGNTCRYITGREILLFFSANGMILFRNNGKYAMLVLLFALASVRLFSKKRKKLWRKFLLILGAAFVSGNLLLSFLFSVTGAQQGDKREMLSMPIQQFARTMLYHGGVGTLPEDDNTMSPEDKALINDFILNEAYRDYRPEISDPVKRHTNTYVARYRLKDFAKTYFRLLARYPGDFVNAALAVNAGWLSPFDESHAIINQQTEEKGLGYVQTRQLDSELNPRGIYKESKWEWLHEKMENWADSNGYLRIPVLKYLFMPGIWLWLLLFFAAYLVLHRQYGRCIPLVFLAGYYGTLFLGPAVQLRYIYPVMAALPFVIAFFGDVSEPVKTEDKHVYKNI